MSKKLVDVTQAHDVAAPGAALLEREAAWSEEAFENEPGEALAHAQHVAWRLFISLHAVLIRRVEHDLSAAGKISFLEYDALMCLYEAPKRKLRISELAAAMLITNSGVSRLVDRLQARGLMARQPCERDGRSFLACLTLEGLAALKDAWQIYRQTVDRDFAAHLSQTDAHALCRVFRAVLAGADAQRFERLIHNDVTDEPFGEL